MIIMKFGGTSVKDAQSMKEVLNIVKNEDSKKVVLLSACYGMTDKLVSLIEDAANSNTEFPKTTIDEIENYHLNLCCELYRNVLFRNYASVLIKRYCNELRKLADGVRLLKECSPRSLDRAASFGELLSTTIFHFLCLENSLKPILIDARKVIKTNSNFTSAKVLMKQTRKNAYKIIGTELGISVQKSNFIKGYNKNNNSEIVNDETKINDKTNLVITQGFIASDLSNKTTTLGRGGSDWSAAILGACLNADVIQIYTDVDGILTSDPRIIKNSKLIRKISFDEVKELSFFGAKVIHPDTIFPALVKRIPVRILNTFNTNSEGTEICFDIENKNSDFKSIVVKKDCYYFDLKFVSRANNEFFINKFLNFFHRRNIKIYFQTSSISRITFLLEKNTDVHFLIKQLSNKLLVELTDVNLLVICGEDILNTKKEKYQAIFNEMLMSKQNCKFIGFANNSLIAAFMPDCSEMIAKQIHRNLFE